MKTTISELFNGNLSPWGEREKVSPDEARLVALLERHEKKLMELLTQEGKQILVKFLDCNGELFYLSCEDVFCKGFSLGVKLMAEAFQ